MTAIQAYYERYWSRDSDVSDGDCTTPERKRRLLAALAERVKPGERVLDLGCGAGKFTAWLKEAGYEALGVDLSSKALRQARAHAPGVEYQLLQPDGTIPAGDAACEAVWCSEVLEYVLDVRAFLIETRRVLRPGGALILTTPYHGLVKNLALPLFKFDRHFDPEGSHIRFFDKRGLQRCLNRVGFEALSWSGIGRCWPLYRTWFVVAERVPRIV